MRARGSKPHAPGPAPAETFAAHRPTARQFILTTLLVALALVAISVWFPAGPSAPWLPKPKPTLEWTLFLSGSGTSFAAILLVFIGYQRLTIDGSAIRVKSTATLYRWRCFDASQVRAIRYSGPGFQSMSIALTLHLAPGPDGDAQPVTFGTSMWWSESAAIDNAVFLAVVAAVARVRPEIVVEGLPPGYTGLLRAPASLM